MNEEIRPYKELALAIVKQSYEDLKSAVKEYKQGYLRSSDTIKENLYFMYSDYYQLLCDLDPDILVKDAFGDEALFIQWKEMLKKE